MKTQKHYILKITHYRHVFNIDFCRLLKTTPIMTAAAEAVVIWAWCMWLIATLPLMSQISITHSDQYASACRALCNKSMGVHGHTRFSPKHTQSAGCSRVQSEILRLLTAHSRDGSFSWPGSSLLRISTLSDYQQTADTQRQEGGERRHCTVISGTQLNIRSHSMLCSLKLTS